MVLRPALLALLLAGCASTPVIQTKVILLDCGVPQEPDAFVYSGPPEVDNLVPEYGTLWTYLEEILKSNRQLARQNQFYKDCLNNQ